MMDWVWWVCSMSNTITNVIGVTANAFMILVILKKTPPQLATYSVIFLNTALCDLFACFTALLAWQRVIPTAVGLYYISNGPCTYFGQSVCYAINGVMIHLLSHAAWSILFSSAYRFYVLNHPPPKRSSLAIVITLMMMDWVWWLSLMSNTVTNVVGVAVNSFMIFVILNKTPPQLATYSIIFLNTVFCDLFACFTALLVRQRAIPATVGVYYIFYGPCTYFGPSTCYFINGVMVHFFCHAVWGILFSSAYRYYIVNHPPPKRSSIAVVLFSLCESDSEQIKLMIEEKYGYNVSSECVSGHLGLDWKNRYISAHLIVSVPITFCGVLIFGKLTTSSLNIAEPVPALNPFILLYAISPYRLWAHGAFRSFRKREISQQAKSGEVALLKVIL
ncbi:unnamed protein product [Haemonchus placei]|uniref:G_PROTEIN_RECEP_F1_2 domain-containing protein n=1 Tax=Haemonchus placei TaxID=6290 RepID=A0A0N4WB99_HAEPC|nr:unnamed protein product [Haemonchus placei]